MANTVDERIVEAKFDASDFEKGVNKTIQKLDELKKSLNLENAGKSVTEFAKETSEGVSKAESALERLSDRFTTFKGMLKQQILSGLAQEFSNAVLSIERSIAGLVKSISSDQVGAGMNKYTEILNSVRTMTAAGIEQDQAYKAVERLGKYSDQTSYSLSQMTSAMSKLVAAGMEIDKAEKSVEGLANMAASAGVNIYDAQRAFVNFSQAYSSGTMRIQDWTSFESLNMGTQNVMKVFMQAAEEVGTLTKTVDKNGNEIYKTTNKVNKAVKAGKQVATSGFRDTLSYGWLDKKTMEQATAVLSYFEDLGVSVEDLTEDQLQQFSAKAFLAAKEARSFADVMGTVKDVVATGWATSFEIIFGKLDKATEFFTWLSESKLAEAIYSIGEFRNAVLTAWGTDWAEGGIFRKRDENGNFGTGRDMLLDTLKNIDELIGSIHEGLESLFPEEFNGYLRRTLSFPEILGKNLGYFTRDIRDASKRLLDFFTIEKEVTEDGETKQKRFLREDIASRIGKIGQGIASVIGVFNKLYEIFTETFEKIFFKVQPIIGAIGDAIGIMLEPFTRLNADTGFFKDFTNAIDNFLIVLDPVLKLVPPVIEFLGELGAFFVDNAIAVAAANIEIISEALGLLIELFGGTSAQKANDGVGVIEGWTNGIREFGESCKEGLEAIKEFFKSLFDDIRTLLGLGEQTEGEDGGFFAKISNFFQTNEFIKNVRKWVSQAIKDVQKFVTMTIPKTLSKLPSVVQSFFYSLFYKKKIVWNGQNMEEKEVPTALKEWLDGAVSSVRDFITSIPSKIAQVPSLIGEFIHSLFWQKAYRYNGSMLEETEVPTALGQWLIDAKDAAWNFITNTLPGAIKELPSIVGRFLHGLLWTRQETDEKGMPLKEPVEVPTKLKEWLDNAVNAVWTFISNTLPGAIKELPSIIGRFLHGLLWTRQETDEKGMPLKEPVEVPSALNAWLTNAKNAAWTFISDTLPGAIKTLPSIVGRFLHGLLWTRQETDEKGMPLKEPVEVPTRLKEWLDNAVSAVWAFISDTLPGAIKELPSIIGRFLHGLLWTRQETDEKGMPLKEPVEVPTRLKEWLDNAVSAVWTFISNTLPGAIKELPSIVGRFLHGLLWTRQETDEKGMPLKEPIEVPSALNTWLTNAASAVRAFVTETLPGAIKELPSIIGRFLNGLLWTRKETDEKGMPLNEPTEVPTALNKWLMQASKDATTFIKNLPNQIREIPSIVDAFVSALVNNTDQNRNLEQAKREITAQFTDEAGNIVDPQGLKLALKDADIRLGKAAEGFNLWESIKEIGGSIKDAFVDLGPDILAGIQGALEWVGKGFSWATKFLTERDKDEPIVDSFAKAIGQEDTIGANSELGKAITSLGQAIGNFITKTIPEFVQAAIDEVVFQIPRMLSEGFEGGLFSAIFGESENKAAEGAEELAKETSEVLTRAGQGIDIAESLLGVKSTNQEEDPVKLEEERLKKIKEAKERINELNTEMASLNPAEFATDEKRVKELNAEIAQYELLLHNLEHFEGTSMTDLNAVTSGAEATVQNQQGFFTNLMNFIGNIGTSKVATIAAAIWGIGYIISCITDTVTITDEVEAAARMAKWHAIEIALLGMIGLVSWIFTLASMDDPTKFNRVQSLFTDFGKLIETLGGIVQTVVAWRSVAEGVSSVADAVSAVQEAKQAFYESGKSGGNEKEGKGQGVLAWLGGLVQGTGGTVLTTLAASSLANVIGEGVSGFFDGLADAFTQISVSVDNFTEFVTSAVSKLVELKEPVETAIQVMSDIGSLLEKFYAVLLSAREFIASSNPVSAIALLTTEIAKDEQRGLDGVPKISDVTTISAMEKSLGSSLDLILAMSTMFSHLSSGLKDFSEIDDPSRAVKDLYEMVANNEEFGNLMDEAVTLCGNIIDKFTMNGMIPTAKLDVASSAMTYIGSVFDAFGTATKSLNLESMQAIDLALTSLEKFVTMFHTSGSDIEPGVLASLVVKDVDLARFGRLIASFGANIKSFFGSMEGVRKIVGTGTENDNSKAFETVIRIANNAIRGIAGTLRIINSNKTLLEMLTSVFTDKSNSMGDLITEYGRGVANYFASINTLRTNSGIEFTEEDLRFFTDVQEAMKSVFEGFKMIGELGNSWNNMSDQTAGFQDLQTKIHNLFTMTFKGENLSQDQKNRGVKGFFDYFIDFMKELDRVAGSVSGYGNDASSSVYKAAFARTEVALEAIVKTIELVKEIGVPDGTFRDLGNNVDQFGYLVEHFTNNKDKFAAFFDMAKEMDTGSLQNASLFTSTLNALSLALQGFADYDPQAYLDTGFAYWTHMNGLQNLLDFSWEDLRTVMQNLSDVFADETVVGNMRTAGYNLDNGLAEGIRSGTSVAIAAAQELANAISGTFTVSWEMHSPSRLFASYGQYLDEGLANGILAYQAAPIDAASEMATEAVDNTMNILNTIKDLAISDMDVTPTITPVVDLTNVDNASDYIDGLYHPGAIGFDLSGVNRNVQSAIPSNNGSGSSETNFAGMISDLRAQIAMLNGAIGTIPGSLSMNGMQVVLDSGAIVGGIIDKVDNTLGRRGFYAGRE